MNLYDKKKKAELIKLESARLADLVGERKLSEREVRDLSWLKGVLDSLHLGEGTPDVVAFLELTGVDEYAVSMLNDAGTRRDWDNDLPVKERELGSPSVDGAKVWAKAKAMAKKYEVPIKFYRELTAPGELSGSYKSWINTQHHGVVEASMQYVHEEDGRRFVGYDGDDEFDNSKSIVDQMNRSYTIPYARFNSEGDYTEVLWTKESPEGKLSAPVKGKERARGEVKVRKGKDGKEYKIMAIYVAKSLETKPYLLQDRIDAAYANQDWDKFNMLLGAQREYQNSMKDRSINVKTGIRKILGKTGKTWDQRVYLMEFQGFVLHSVVTFKELPDHVQKEIQAKRDRWKINQPIWAIYNAFKQNVTKDVMQLAEIQDAVHNGILKGDDLGWDCYLTSLRRVAQEIGVRAPWLFKPLLKPFYKDLFLGRKVVNVPLFNDEGDIL